MLPAAVKAQLFQAFNDAVVSEHVARMVAMKAATDNAGQMGKLYTRKFNRARQAQITTELTEIGFGRGGVGVARGRVGGVPGEGARVVPWLEGR